MTTQTAEKTTMETLQTLLRGIGTLSDEYIKRLADFVDELIEEQEEAEDIAYIDARKDEPTISFEDVLAKHEAKFGPLD